jgi:hypothetical protein
VSDHLQVKQSARNDQQQCSCYNAGDKTPDPEYAILGKIILDP